MGGDNGNRNRQLQRLVIVNRDIAESDHTFKRVRESGFYPARAGQQRENVAGSRR